MFIHFPCLYSSTYFLISEIFPGYCPRNITCDCETSVEESRRIVEDRNFALFNRDFEGAIIMKIFTKPSKDDDKKDDDDDDKKKKKFPKKKKKRMNFPSIGKISKLPDCNGDSKSVGVLCKVVF